MGRPGSAPGPAGPGAAFHRTARPDADRSRPAGGVPPWEITDSFLAVPPAPAETTRAVPEPEPPRPLSSPPGTGTAGAGDSTGSFPAIDPGAKQRSFPPGDGKESFPASRPRANADAFRLFPPMRSTDNNPPAPPAADGQD